MAMLMLELPPHKARTAFNLRRWAELLADRELAKVEGRIETDRHGHIIMSPPPAPSHGSFQSEIGHLLRSLMDAGRVLTECPISTADGVKAADVAWAHEAVGRASMFCPRTGRLRGGYVSEQYQGRNPGENRALLRCGRQRGLALRPERCDELFQSGRYSLDARLEDVSPVPEAS